MAALAPAAAEAQEARAAAQALFDEAVQDMNAKAYDRACPKFDAVVRMLPGKVGATIQLAKCYEASGKLASAWSWYRAAAAAAVPGDARGPESRDKADELAAHVPKLTIAVATANRSLSGFAVTRGGQEMSAAEWNNALPIDPGRYDIVASAPGKHRFTTSVAITLGSAPIVVDVPPLADDATSRPAWSWVALSGGIAALGVAAGFGVDGLSAKRTIDAMCGGQRICPTLTPTDADALNLRKDRGLGVFLGAGAVGVAAVTAGLVGLLRGQSSSPSAAHGFLVAPAIGEGMGGLELRGRF